ncbi:hypothetical protein [Schlesneria paludicola]|uniref:hypothetical protein n=1 Tax=Schlesneria paludicola TaxID=360056 RepID=UPI00029ACE5A|nr:hypothetical protein [Schlesneria paludicola]
MIPDEHGREDVMREAVSLTQRVELRFPGREDPVVLGFNDLGWLFVYPGRDAMYRFDDQGRLRRAYVEGLLYRTSGQTLAELTRQHEPITSDSDIRSQTILVRRDLTVDELDVFRMHTLELIEALHRSVHDATVIRQVPDDRSTGREQFAQGLKRVLDAKSFLAPAIVRRK